MRIRFKDGSPNTERSQIVVNEYIAGVSNLDSLIRSAMEIRDRHNGSIPISLREGEINVYGSRSPTKKEWIAISNLKELETELKDLQLKDNKEIDFQTYLKLKEIFEP